MRSRKVPVASAAGLPDRPYVTVMIGTGDDAEITSVLAVRGNTLTVGRWRWWHTAAWRARRVPGRVKVTFLRLRADVRGRLRERRGVRQRGLGR